MPLLSKKPFYRSIVSETNQTERVTVHGPCLSKGSYTRDGSLFIGNHSSEKWNSHEVRKNHKKILDARKNIQSRNKQMRSRNYSYPNGCKFSKNSQRQFSEINAWIKRLESHKITENSSPLVMSKEDDIKIGMLECHLEVGMQQRK